MSEVEKLIKVPNIVKERIDKSLLELRLAVKTLEGTLSVLEDELNNICKECEHFRIPDYARDSSYATPKCQFYGECDVKTYKHKLEEEKRR